MPSDQPNPRRTRFAPSPTGNLHLGSIRTALYCWLLARSTKGKFLLRIEDTDQIRSTLSSERQIFSALEWLDLLPDEKEIRQSQQKKLYLKAVKQLLSEGKAYRCRCSQQRLDTLRQEQLKLGQKPRYDGHCRPDDALRDRAWVEPDNTFVVRFRTPEQGTVVFTDSVKGTLEFDNSELDDLVILRSDGNPTYNFCVVVDDHYMQVNTVIRGDDHVNNTPRQIHIFKALGYPVPEFAHLPMILGSDGKRMSKRTGSVDVLSFFDQGIPAQAVRNYLLRLGWARGDQEYFDLKEMVRYFDLSGIQKSPARFDEKKLWWFSEQVLRDNKETGPCHLIDEMDTLYLARKDERWQATTDQIDERLKKQCSSYHTDELINGWENLRAEKQLAPILNKVISINRPRSSSLHDLLIKTVPFFLAPCRINEDAQKHVTTNADLLAVTQTRLSGIPTALFTADRIKEELQAVVCEREVGFGKLAQALRGALFGSLVSPSIDISIELLGHEQTQSRILSALLACGHR